MRSFNKFNHPLTDGTVKKRYKMYKSKKHWVYSALLFLGTGAVVATSGGIAKADVTTTSSVPETSASRSTGDLTSSATSSSEESPTSAEVTTPAATAIAAADNQSAQSAVIQFKDENGSILKETTISGESGAAVSESLFAADYQSMLQAGYVLAAAGDGTIGQVFDDDAAVAQTFVITLQKVEATTPASATGTTAAAVAESTATATTTTTSAAAVEATAKPADATTTAPVAETTDTPAEVNAAEKVTAEGSVTPVDSTENTTPSVSDSQTEGTVSTVETTELANSGQFPAGTAITVLDHVLNVVLPTDTSLTATQQQLLEHFALNNKLTVSVAQLAPSAQSKIMLASSTKTYDNKTQTPVSYTVQLSPNLVAPASWYESGTVDSYITIDPTDVDTSSVSQNVGTYAVTLTASGLAKVQAANPTATLTLGDVTAGTVEIKQAIVPSSTIWIVSQEKDYDNDATNAPTTYQVKLPTYLTAPTSWVASTAANDDATVNLYEVTASEVTAVASQEVGTYPLTLTADSLAALQAANLNYQVTSTSFAKTYYKILSHNDVILGTSTISKSVTTMPATLEVQLSSNLIPLSGWTIKYQNGAAGTSIVYSVPTSSGDLDLSKISLGTEGNYAFSLSDKAIANLAAANAGKKFDNTNIQDGQLTISNSLPSATFAPGNFYVEILEYERGQNATLAKGQGLTLKLWMLNSNSKDKPFTNLTEVIIIPKGFEIGIKDENGLYSVSDNPTDSLKETVETEFSNLGIDYSGLTVTRMKDYDGRQTFMVQIAKIDLNSTATREHCIYLPVVVSMETDVTNGYIGTEKTKLDSSIMYLTSDEKYTKGSYNTNLSGYVDIPNVANALGLKDAIVLDSSFVGFVYPYTIIQTNVEDTYNLVGPGNINLGTKTTSGIPGTTYDPSTFLDSTITKDGKSYVLVANTVVTPQVYPWITGTVTDTTKAAAGATYQVYYQEVVNASDTAVDAKIGSETKPYDGVEATNPTEYQVTIPANMGVPTDWIATSQENTYTIATTSGDLDLSGLTSQEVGDYPVTLSKQGLAKYAAANPLYLITKQNVVGANFTITATQQTVEVHFVLKGDKNKTDLIQSEAITGAMDSTFTYDSKGKQTITAAGKNYQLENDGSIAVDKFDRDSTTSQKVYLTYEQVVTTTFITVDEDGNPIQAPEASTDVTGVVGELIPNSEIPTIPGYTIKPGQDLRIPATDNTPVTVVYTADSQSLTIQYYDDTAKKIWIIR
jgi:hypothetical protein